MTHPQIDEARKEIYQFCTEYASHPSRGRTIILFGENGCGKTRLAKLVKHWADKIATKLPLVNREDLNGQVGTAFAEMVNWPMVVDGFKKDQWDVIEELACCNLAIIDDIGAEHDPSRIGVEKLYVLLSRRESRWNIITTNVKPDQWDKKFERRIASRLYRNAMHIDLSAVPDYSTT